MSRKKRRGVSIFSLACKISERPIILQIFYFVQLIEKRRRDRINSCLVQLRKLVPAAFEKQVSGFNKYGGNI